MKSMLPLLVTLIIMATAGSSPDLAAAEKSRKGKKSSSTSSTPAKTAFDAVETAYEKLLADDDAAQTEVDQWIRDNNAFQVQGAGLSSAALAAKVEQRLEPVRKAYDDFLGRYPKHVQARLAYGSFLNDTGDEAGAVTQWEKAREIDPKNPAAWNNLANHFGHRGPVKKAFEYYAAAIKLEPDEPVYYQNLGTTVFLFRKDAKEFYQIDEQQVFDKALELYRKALSLAPDDFLLAQDVAQTYYGIKPPRHEEAIAAWDRALRLAADDVQREGVLIHLARTKIQCGKLHEARQHLDAVTNAHYDTLRSRLERNLAAKLGTTTNTPAAEDTSPVSGKESKI